jgi:hypothetical protein
VPISGGVLVLGLVREGGVPISGGVLSIVLGLVREGGVPISGGVLSIVLSASWRHACPGETRS